MQLFYGHQNNVKRCKVSTRSVARYEIMDRDEFLKKLEEVAEYYIPDTWEDTVLERTRKINQRRRQDQYDDDDNDFLHSDNDCQEPLIERQFPPVLTKVKKQSQNCDDCNRHCPDGREIDVKIHEHHGQRIWRQRCVNCGLYKNPDSGKFDLNSREVHLALSKYIRHQQQPRRPYQRRQVGMGSSNQLPAVNIDENPQEIIRYYPRENAKG